METFEQPKLETPNETEQPNAMFAPRVELPPDTLPSGTKIDPLKRAVGNMQMPQHKPAEPEKPNEPGRYRLRYQYNGQTIEENHKDIPHALQRVGDLKRIGIVPETYTV